jgi:hypothetical protein
MTMAVDAQSNAIFFMMLIPPRQICLPDRGKDSPPDASPIARPILRFKDSSTALKRFWETVAAMRQHSEKMAENTDCYGCVSSRPAAAHP